MYLECIKKYLSITLIIVSVILLISCRKLLLNNDNVLFTCVAKRCEKASPLNQDGVIVLHGIFRTSSSMRSLSRFLEGSGFKVLNLNYPSTKYPIEKLADMIHKDISQFASSVTGKVHFVGYSMGGLLIRAYFKKYKPDKFGRVVMIGTPNHGSEVADFLKNFILYKKFYGPAGQQLITNQDGFKEIFANTDFELGIIAGNKSIDPISSKLINKPSDGKVSVDSTKLEGAKDHIVLPYSHTFFPSNKQMFRQVLSFLKFGKFVQNYNSDKAKQD